MKRFFLLLLFLFCFSGRAHAAIAVAQACSHATSSSTTAVVTMASADCSTGATNASGDTLAAYCEQSGQTSATALAVSSSPSATWTAAAPGLNSSGSTKGGEWYYTTNAVAMTTVTCTYSGSASSMNEVVYDLTGTAVSNAEETNDSSSNNSFNNSTVTTLTSGTFNPTNSGEIAIYGVGMGTGGFTSPTAGTNFTIPTKGTTTADVITQYRLSAPTGSSTTSVSWSTAHSVQGSVIVLVPAPTCKPTMTLLGVSQSTCG